MTLLAADPPTIVMSVSGIAAFGACIGAAVIASVKILIAYDDRKDKEATVTRAAAERALEAARKENIEMFRDQTLLFKEVIRALTEVKAEIQRSSYPSRSGHTWRPPNEDRPDGNQGGP